MQVILEACSADYVNVREIRTSSQEWTVQRHWQHWKNKAEDEDKHNTEN